MDFEIQRLFQAETLQTEDPWGMGYVFSHRSTADPSYREWLASVPGGDLSEEIQRRLRTEVGRLMLKSVRNGTAKTIGPIDEKTLEDVRNRILDELSETYEAEDPPEVDQARGVSLLLTGWDGVKDIDGAAVPFSADAAYELLSSRTLVPAGQDGEGRTVGEVLCQMILETARGAAAIDSVAEGAAEKKSAAATDGN